MASLLAPAAYVLGGLIGLAGICTAFYKLGGAIKEQAIHRWLLEEAARAREKAIDEHGKATQEGRKKWL